MNASQGYRVKVTVSTEREGMLSHTNEFLLSEIFSSLQQALDRVNEDIHFKLNNSLYFRSQKKGYDLVYYSQVAQLNTYIAYRVIVLSKQTLMSGEKHSKK